MSLKWRNTETRKDPGTVWSNSATKPVSFEPLQCCFLFFHCPRVFRLKRESRWLSSFSAEKRRQIFQIKNVIIYIAGRRSGQCLPVNRRGSVLPRRHVFGIHDPLPGPLRRGDGAERQRQLVCNLCNLVWNDVALLLWKISWEQIWSPRQRALQICSGPRPFKLSLLPTVFQKLVKHIFV